MRKRLKRSKMSWMMKSMSTREKGGEESRFVTQSFRN